MFTFMHAVAVQHQKDMLRDAENRHREREMRKQSKEARHAKILMPAGNGFFRWSDERDQAA